jgi:cytoskeleton protein RodZ
LRKARQLKGEELAQISRVLKIRKDHLEALEESNFDAIPGRAYAIGFVRSYAEYLGLDAAACLVRLKAEIAGRGEAKEGPVPISAPRDRKLPQGTVIFAVILIIALIYGIYYLIVAVNRMASQPVPPVPPQLAAQAGLTPPPSPPAPSAQPASDVSQSSSDGDAAPPPSIPETPAAPQQAAAAMPAASTLAALPEGHVYGAQNKSRITLRAHKPARITVLGPDSRLYLDRLLETGDSYLVPDATGLTLSTSDGGAVEMIIDGSSVGYAGNDGAALTAVSLNPQELSGRRARG